MKCFSIILLLLAALATVFSIPNPHAFGLIACGDDAGCLERIYGRALVASSLSLKEMTTVDGAPTSSYDKLVTVIVETYTTIPCSTESTDIGVGTTMVSKHSTSTDLLTVTVTSSSSSTSIVSSDSFPSNAIILSTALTSVTSSVAITASSSAESSSTGTTSSIILISSTSSILNIANSLSTASSSSSTSSVGVVSSASSTSTMAYVPPSYGVGSTTRLQTYSGIVMSSSISSIEALSATQPAIIPTLTQPIIPITPTSASSLSPGTTTTSLTSTHTTTIVVSSFNIQTAAVSSASVSTIESEACNVSSTVYITITGALPSRTNTPLPANSLDSQSAPHSSSGAASAVGGYQASTDALSVTVTTSHLTGTATTITSSLLVMPTPAANSSHPSNSTASISPFVNGSRITSSGTGHAARGQKNIKGALVMCIVGALVMFAI